MKSSSQIQPDSTVSGPVTTMDFHVTAVCSQACPYCWGPQGGGEPVDTATALRIVSQVRALGARRLVFTGGDPVARTDLALLMRHAKALALEVALSTTGDRLTPAFLEEVATDLDLISLPLDGASEETNARTKKRGHFTAIMAALELLRRHPAIDVKLCTPVTRHNLNDLPNLVNLADSYAQTTRARVFCNLFQVFPRAMFPVDWRALLVTHDEFHALQHGRAGTSRVQLHFLDHETLDRLYVLIFPQGQLVIPSADQFLDFGPFWEIGATELQAALAAAQFDRDKHLRHAQKWERHEP